MLEVPGLRAARGDAQGDVAVLLSPGVRRRRIDRRGKAPPGVQEGRQHQHRLGHPVADPADGVAHHIALREQVLPTCGQREMQVHPRARPLAEGLGHEAGLHAEAPGRGAQESLGQDDVIRRPGEVAVAQGQLVLPGGIFRDQALHRQGQRLGALVDRVEEGRHLVEFVHRHGVGGMGLPPGQRIARGLHPAGGIALAVDEVKLQLHRAHRREAHGLGPGDLRHQHVARIGGLRVVGMHRDQNDPAPGRRDQPERPRDRPAPAVPAAIILRRQGALDVVARDVLREEARRHAPS